MDYLDPNKKKAHRTRLFIGYALMAVAIAFATVILVYMGSGYYVDRQTGDLIQNGQIYVNSDPGGAQIYLNDKQQKAKTDNKLVVPSGSYKVGMKKDGYRDWEQTLQLEGGKVQRLDYARLIPTTLKSVITQTFASNPTHISQSPDRKYLSLVFAEKPNAVYFYDLTQPEKAPSELVINPSVLSAPAQVGSFVVSEWTEDAKVVLVQNKVGDVVQDYLLVNRTDAAATKNLTTYFGLKTASFSLRDRSVNNVFIFDKVAKTLAVGTVSDKQVTQRLSGVLQYSPVDGNTILYITESTAAVKDKVQVRITDGNDKSYLLRELTPSTQPYLLAGAKLGSSTVVALGVGAENKVSVFRNPVGYLKANPDKNIPLATTVFQLPNPTEVSFSTDASVVMARGGQKIASHYFEEDRSARFELTVPVGALPLRWTDGKHLQVVSNGFAYIIDFDGANMQKLVETSDSLNAYFDNKYQNLYTFSSAIKPFNISQTQIKLDN